MIERIKNLDPNFRLKVISLLLAMVLWYMINYFSDPAIRMTVNNVSVQILHGEVIENHIAREFAKGLGHRFGSHGRRKIGEFVNLKILSANGISLHGELTD